MEESAPKRRRTSPRTSVGVNRDATPEITGAGPSRPRKHPSFASPTKSSLSRYNPQILERRSSASPSKPSESRLSPRRPIRANSEESLTDALTAQPPPTGQDVAASDPADERDPEARQDTDVPGSGPSLRRTRGGLTAAPRRSPAKPSPRPLPPPGPEGEDDLNPFLGRVLRRSPHGGINIPPAPEPELPQPVDDPVSSTPPRGIHSSPSRWRDKSRPKRSSPLKGSPMSTSPLKSSPLKPRSTRTYGTTGPRTGSPLKGAHGHTVRQPLGQRSENIILDSRSSNARKVPAFDPNATKRREIEAMQADLAALQNDLAIAERENQRIRLMQESGRRVSPPNGDEVVDLLWRHLLPPDVNALPPLSQQLLKAALNPMGLLPFSKPVQAVSFPSAAIDEMASVKSHHPVSMSAEEERPYLQLFTPFEATTDIAVLPTQPNKPLRQRHTITIRSRTTPGLFSAKVNMVVDATNLSILELGVPALEPAAKPELGPFINKICSGDCNRSMQRNIGIISWAMGDWLRVAHQRALFWAQLQDELASKQDVLAAVRRVRERKTRRGQGGEEASDDEDGSRNHTAVLKSSDLLQFMGKQFHEMDIPPASGKGSQSSLRLEWRIEFDWTGEARSKVAVQVGVPTKWHGVDERGALGALPKLFEDLVKGGEEPAAAVRTVVALLAGE